MQEVLRQEKKYLLTVADSYNLKSLLNQSMLADSHNGAEGYRIRSLYFDTLNDGDYFDKLNGVELRRKMRLRIYDPSADFAMLEMKQKEGAFQRKRSLAIRRQDAQKLIGGDYSPLLSYEEPFAAECYGLLHRLCYRPRTVVEYRRQAYIAQGNHIRVTLDTCIVANEACYDIFSENLALYPVLEPFNTVLEVKYDGFLFSHVKSLVNSVNRSELAVSKYCLARSVGLHMQF